jgi:SAM-dependent methyltransferase
VGNRGETLRRLIPAGLRRALKALFFFGFRYRCPFCRSRLRALLPYGHAISALPKHHVIAGGYREHALCPVCGSKDRDRLLYLFLSRKTDVFDAPKRLLHVAPEPRVAAILSGQTNLDYLTADLHSDKVMLKMDITDIRLPDRSFDAIICNHVLEHVVDDRKAMSELFRILKPGGWAILQVPMSPSLEHTYEDASKTTPEAREEAFGQWDHVRIYAKDYEQRLTQAGFTVDVFRWTTAPERFGGRRNVFGLNEQECVYFLRR